MYGKHKRCSLQNNRLWEIILVSKCRKSDANRKIGPRQRYVFSNYYMISAQILTLYQLIFLT